MFINKNNTQNSLLNGKHEKSQHLLANLGKHSLKYGELVIENPKDQPYLQTQETKAEKFYPRTYYLPPRPKQFNPENAIQKHLKNICNVKKNTEMVEEKNLLTKRSSPVENHNDLSNVPTKALPPIVNLEPKIQKILEPLREEIVDSTKSNKNICKKPISTQDYEIQPTKTQFKSNFKMEEEI